MTEPHIGDRVKLKEVCADVYLHAQAEATASVRDRKVDEYGHALIWVAWDPGSHTEMSGWTYPGHFEVINHDNHTIAQFTDKTEQRELEKKKQQFDTEADYIDFLTQAVDKAMEAEGFFMIIVNKDEKEETGHQPYGFAIAKTEAAGVVLEAQLVQLAADAHQHNALRALNNLKEDDD